MKTATPIRKIVKVRDVPPSWRLDLPDDLDAAVTVWISPAKSQNNNLADCIGTGKGVYETRADADAYVHKLREEWHK